MTIAGKTLSNTPTAGSPRAMAMPTTASAHTTGSARSAYQARRSGRVMAVLRRRPDRAVTLASREGQRDDRRPEGKDERDERRRKAAERRRCRQAEAETGEREDGADPAGSAFGGGSYETPCGRRAVDMTGSSLSVDG